MAYDRINVRGIIRDGDQIFLVRSKGTDYWSLPGGGLDRGECAQKCLIRELHEELNVKTTVGDLLFSQEFYAKDFDSYILELFFEVNNSHYFIDGAHQNSSHGFELGESKWVVLDNTLALMPKFLAPELTKPTGNIFFSNL